MYSTSTERISMQGNLIHQPPAISFHHNILIINWIYLALWFYFDHIISSNRGVAYSFYFIFQKSYWKSILPGRKEVKEANKLKRKTKPSLGNELSEE